MNASAIDEIRELEAKRSSLVSVAREQALEAIHSNIELLSELGFVYELSEKGQKKPKPTRRKRSGISGKPAGECPICEFATDPPHDKRHHRSQVASAPFTPAELEERGFAVVPNEQPADPQTHEEQS